MKDRILKYALQNAIKFKGKANPGAIIGQLMREDPSIKSQLKDLQPLIQETIKEISTLSVEEQIKKLQEIAPELLEKKVKEKKSNVPELDTKNIITRFAPSPSGPLHIGHAYPLLLNAALSKKYEGKLIIRIEDTNPEKIYVPAYEQIPKDAEWVTGMKVETVIQSDRMDLYYQTSQTLLENNHAYICTCEPESFRNLITNKQACPCRDLSTEQQQQRWQQMLNKDGFKQGEAVLRLKTDVEHKNPAMRDFPLARINTTAHPRQGEKYRVWPLMNLSVATDDHYLGITHSVRGKDHIDNEKRQQYIHNYMGWVPPVPFFNGRINFTGMEVSCSKTRPLIEDGTYKDWDDIRLPFLVGLKRRGYQPHAFQKYAEEVGFTQNDKTVSKEEFFKTLNSFNKEILESTSHRYFFVEDPIAITIENVTEQDIELDLHPDNKKGGRAFKTKSEFYITKQDHDQITEGEIVRLMDCLNFKREGDTFTFHSTDYESFKEAGKKIIHWLPKDNGVSVSILLDDGETISGLAEQTVHRLKEGDIIQFERFGFVRLDNKNSMAFWLTHR